MMIRRQMFNILFRFGGSAHKLLIHMICSYVSCEVSPGADITLAIYILYPKENFFGVKCIISN